MKLRNKKTGVIWNIPKMRHPTIQEDDISFFAHNRDEGCLFSYKSIAELNDEWEDYKPVELLIEGRSQRAVLKAAANLSGATTVTVRRWDTARIVIFDFAGKCRVELKDIGINIKNDGLYTITELCGEAKKKGRK